MGNRAVIITESADMGLYLHWDGSPDQVQAFLSFCELMGYRSPETDGYGWAQLAKVIGNYIDENKRSRGLSIGLFSIRSPQHSPKTQRSFVRRMILSAPKEAFRSCLLSRSLRSLPATTESISFANGKFYSISTTIRKMNRCPRLHCSPGWKISMTASPTSCRKKSWKPMRRKRRKLYEAPVFGA